MTKLSIFDKINECYCGYDLKDVEGVCPKCGRKRYRMSMLPENEDSVDSTMHKMRNAKRFATKILAFQLARTKDGM